MDKLDQRLLRSRHTIRDFTPPADGWAELQRRMNAEAVPASATGTASAGTTAKIIGGLLLLLVGLVAAVVYRPGGQAIVPAADRSMPLTADRSTHRPTPSLRSESQTMSSLDDRLIPPTTSMLRPESRTVSPLEPEALTARPQPTPSLPTIDHSVSYSPTLSLPAVRPTKVIPAGKPKGWSGWTFDGTVGINGVTLYGYDNVYRQSTPADATHVFSDGGSPVYAEVYRSVNENLQRERATGIQLTAARQLANGLWLGLGLGYNRTWERPTGFGRNGLAENDLIERVRGMEHAVPLSLEVQYTFLRRHRFRPYLGVSFAANLYYAAERHHTVFDAQRRHDLPVRTLRSEELIFSTVAVRPEFGFQYQWSPHWSAGLYSRPFHHGGSMLGADVIGIRGRYYLRRP